MALPSHWYLGVRALQERKDVEGSLFLLKRRTNPRFQFIILNKKSQGAPAPRHATKHHVPRGVQPCFSALLRTSLVCPDASLVQTTMWRTCSGASSLRSQNRTCCTATRRTRRAPTALSLADAIRHVYPAYGLWHP